MSTVAFGTPVRNFLKFGARGMGDGGLGAELGNEAIRMGRRFANSCEFGAAVSTQGKASEYRVGKAASLQRSASCREADCVVDVMHAASIGDFLQPFARSREIASK